MDISFDSLGSYLVRSKLWAFRGDEYGSLTKKVIAIVRSCASLRRGERSVWRRGAVGLDGEEPEGWCFGDYGWLGFVPACLRGRERELNDKLKILGLCACGVVV